MLVYIAELSEPQKKAKYNKNLFLLYFIKYFYFDNQLLLKKIVVLYTYSLQQWFGLLGSGLTS